MADPKGNHLYVNLSASQTRKRLAGFGHGVRKIHSAGKNQAVIIHTATGQHLTELESKFSDVGFSSSEIGLGRPIEELHNLGAASGAWLRAAGITTIEELREVGPVFAFMQVKRRNAKASRNLLWALAAGLQDRDWCDLSESEKQRLQLELR
jgi:hypothetical protein